MRLVDYFRPTPGGIGSAGKSIAVKRHSDDMPIPGSPFTTDATGMWTAILDGCPGPVYSVATDGTVTRIQSSKAVGMAGAVQLGELPYVLPALGDGVLPAFNQLAVSAGTGLGLTIATGGALVKGIQYINYVIDTNGLIPTPAHATLHRIDTVVIEVGRVGAVDEGRAELKLVTGTPAVSPVPPTLTQTATVWQYPLADGRVNAGATTTIVTDRRTFFLSGSITRNPTIDPIARRADPTPVTIGTTQQVVPELTVSPVLLSGVIYDVIISASLVCFISDPSKIVSIAPYIGSVGNAAPFLPHDITADIAITNTHHTIGVVGTGAPYSCGLLVTKTGGRSTNAHYTTGVLTCRAIPRS